MKIVSMVLSMVFFSFVLASHTEADERINGTVAGRCWAVSVVANQTVQERSFDSLTAAAREYRQRDKEAFDKASEGFADLIASADDPESMFRNLLASCHYLFRVLLK